MSSTVTSPEVADAHAEHHYDEAGTRLGFCLFLYTELFLFGAFFVLYAVYRSKYLVDFQEAARALDTTIGAVNTVILLISSLTVVLSINYLKRDMKKLSLLFLAITMMCGVAFLVIKGFEWNAKFHHHLYLQLRSGVEAGMGSPLLTPGSGQMLPQGQVLFFGLYFIMTGTHALHIVIGLTWFAIVYYWLWKDKIPGFKRVGVTENAGLYWHLVDVIWIYLFPLYYLVV